jgi:hypothetical protein
MPKPRIALECFDPDTGWPIKVYDSYTDAGSDGHKRAAIDACLKGERKTHHGMGWRQADVLSRLPHFVSLACVERPRAEPAACIRFADFYAQFIVWAGLARPILTPERTSGYNHWSAVQQRVQRRYGFGEVPTVPIVRGGEVMTPTVEVVRGLVWA